MENILSVEHATGLVADMLGSGVLFTRHQLQEHFRVGLANGRSPQEVFQEILQIVENRIRWNSREHGRIIALLLCIDHAQFQAAVLAHLEIQANRVAERGLGVGWVESPADVEVSNEARGIVDVLAGWQPQIITDDEDTWLRDTLPTLINGWDSTNDHQTLMNTSLPNFPDGSYNGVLFGPRFPDHHYHVPSGEEQFFRIPDMSIELNEAAGAANALPVEETVWGESPRGGLDGQ